MTRSRRRARRLPRRAPAAVACALALLALTVVLPGASARFSSVTGNPASSWAADGLAAPADLAAAQTCSVPAAITPRGATSATAQGSLTLLVPTGTEAGDVLLAQVGYGAGTAPAKPPGWTLVRPPDSSGGLASALYWKEAVAGEGSATFAFPAGSTVTMAGGMAAYSGVDTTTPVDASAGLTGYGTEITTPAVTTTRAGTVLVRLTTSAREPYPVPSGTERWRVLAVTGTGGVSAGDEPFAAPGTAPVARAVAPSGLAASWVGQTVALRRPPGTPSAALTWTASTSTWATGYRLERSPGGATPPREITPIGAPGATEGPLENGTPYTFRLWAFRGTWTSDVVTVTLTPSC
jgi:hypothetical protein